MAIVLASRQALQRSAAEQSAFSPDALQRTTKEAAKGQGVSCDRVALCTAGIPNVIAFTINADNMDDTARDATTRRPAHLAEGMEDLVARPTDA